ncbi:MAG: MBL fold metallo-hydrolase [Bacillota bacterium]
MKVYKVIDNLYMFSTYENHIGLTFNQFLLLGKEPLLVHTGSRPHTVTQVPELKNLLGDQELTYAFISHFESDECGGLGVLTEHYPHVRPICSAVTARQIAGFGLAHGQQTVVKAPGDTLETAEYSLQFISYPSEMHLWEGLLAFEQRHGILFSSDLFISRGFMESITVGTTWSEEVRKISEHQIPGSTARENLKQALLPMPVKMVAPGHGPCLDVN